MSSLHTMWKKLTISQNVSLVHSHNAVLHVALQQHTRCCSVYYLVSLSHFRNGGYQKKWKYQDIAPKTDESFNSCVNGENDGGYFWWHLRCDWFQSHSLTHSLTPCSRFLLEKQIVKSASEEILCLLWNPKVHCHIHRNLPPVLIFSKMNPVHTLPPYFPKINSGIFPSMPSSSKWSLPFMFSNQNIVCISHFFHACHIPCLSHVPWFDLPNNILWSLQLQSSSYAVFSSLLPPPVRSKSAHYFKIPSTCVPSSLWETMFHTHKKTR